MKEQSLLFGCRWEVDKQEAIVDDNNIYCSLMPNY